jgi:hypothetical protein
VFFCWPDWRPGVARKEGVRGESFERSATQDEPPFGRPPHTRSSDATGRPGKYPSSRTHGTFTSSPMTAMSLPPASMAFRRSYSCAGGRPAAKEGPVVSPRPKRGERRRGSYGGAAKSSSSAAASGEIIGEEGVMTFNRNTRAEKKKLK